MKNEPFLFQNGDKVEDKLTGLRGTVTSRTDYITGCNRYTVEQGATDMVGQICITQTDFDEARLVKVEAAGPKQEPDDNDLPF